LSELDYVIYISEGKIIAQDKHADLLTKSSKYFDFIEKGKLK
jgi:ABC-type multidrug transport system fused ATPase/permease subunit